MNADKTPIAHQVVLVGGGHSHALLLRMHGMNPWPGVDVTLVSDVTHAPYSGMLPGYIAGYYDYDEVHIDLRRLCQFAQVRFIQSPVTGLDLREQRVQLQGRPSLRFDSASINIGSTPQMLQVPGAAEWATPSKPVPALLDHWHTIVTEHDAGRTPKNLAIVGGGAGGVEMALCMHQRLDRKADIHLIHKGTEILSTHNHRVRRHFNRFLQEHGVHTHLGEEVVEVHHKNVRCASGKTIDADHTFWVTQAGPAAWPSEAGLQCDDTGFVLVSNTLQSISHPNVFAAGDIASMQGQPRPKSGVFAVRQGAPLFDNIGALVKNEPLHPYNPQREFLSLIGTATRSAVASRRWLAHESPLMWKLKDRIDRQFMRKFSEFPEMDTNKTLSPEIANIQTLKRDDPLLDLKRRAEMRCLGCAAKVGGSILRSALLRIRSQAKGTPSERVLSQLDDSDDAAVFPVPAGQHLVQTVDYMPALLSDPYLFARVTSIHCLSDLFAMGAKPYGVLVQAQVPFGADAIIEEQLFQMLSGVVDALAKHNAYLLGGHTAEGEQLALGVTCNGFMTPQEVLHKQGMRPGERLILTKPIGTGTLFAGEMRLKTRGADMEKAVNHLLVDNEAASNILQNHGASACTDVTGFGLLGHLLEMAKPSKVAIQLNLASIPTLSGAKSTASAGILSSIHTQNRMASEGVTNPSGYVSHPTYPLLFDPQTSGGLLASVPANRSESCVQLLKKAGYHCATCIGDIHKAADLEQPVTLQ